MENKYLRILNEKKEKPVDGYTPIKGKDYFDGKDGKDGYTPVKGKDYFDGKDGKTPVKGKDYFTKKEVEAFKKEVVPVKGKDYFDGKDGKTPVKGKDYFTKKDILSVKKEVGDSAKEIRDKLETLKGEERLDATAIKHLPLPSPLYGGGGPKDFIELEDVPESYKGQGGKYLRVKNDESGVEFRVGSGGGSGGGAWGEIEGNIEDQLDLQQELAKKMNTVSLATVATSGSYNDLTHKPTIPTVTNDFTNAYKTKLDGIATGATVNRSDTATDLLIDAKANVADLATVATSGSYNDLSNKPTIPTVTNDFTNAYKTKLDGIETSATKNDTDANLKNRANHTGTQAISTIDGLQNALDGKQPTGDYITEEDMNTELSSKADLVDGTVPSSQLPSYVDDVLEFNNLAGFPETGEAGKIYVAKDTNKTYRWGGSEYVVISETIALGETSATAYRGDHGKTAYDHSQITSGNPHGTTASDIGAIPTSEKGVASGVATLGLDGLVPATQLPTGGGGGGDGQVVYDYVVAASDSTSKAKGGADAVCDGTNDDVEIQAAIDEVAVKGGRVLLHAGTYILGDSVELKGNIILDGVGESTVITTPESISMFTFPASNIANLFIRFMKIDGMNSTTIFTGGINKLEHLNFSFLKIVNSAQVFTTFYELADSTFFSCIFENVGVIGSFGGRNNVFGCIYNKTTRRSVSSTVLFVGNGSCIQGSKFYLNGLSSNTYLLTASDSSQSFMVSDCYFEGGNGRVMSQYGNFQATNCRFVSMGGQSILWVGGLSTVTGCLFRQCNNSGGAVYLNGGCFIGNNVEYCGGGFLDFSESGVVVGNRFYSSGVNNSGAVSSNSPRESFGNMMLETTQGGRGPVDASVRPYLNLTGATIPSYTPVRLSHNGSYIGVVLAVDGKGYLGMSTQNVLAGSVGQFVVKGWHNTKINNTEEGITYGDPMAVDLTDQRYLKKASVGDRVIGISKTSSTTTGEIFVEMQTVEPYELKG